MVDFKLSFLQESLFEGTKDLFTSEGFTFIKSKKLYKKKKGNNTIEFAFDFINYGPISYDFKFISIIWIKEIMDLIKEFNIHFDLNEGVRWSTALFEGEFVGNLSDAERKFRTGYVNVVQESKEIPILLSRMLSRIRDLAIPLSYNISNLEGYQDYYFNNRSELTKNITYEPLIISALMAAYLKNYETYLDISSFLRMFLDKEKVQQSDYKNIYSIIDKADEFASHHYNK